MFATPLPLLCAVDRLWCERSHCIRLRQYRDVAAWILLCPRTGDGRPICLTCVGARSGQPDGVVPAPARHLPASEIGHNLSLPIDVFCI